MDYVSIDQNEIIESNMENVNLDTIGILEEVKVPRSTNAIGHLKNEFKKKAKKGHTKMMKIRQSLNEKYSNSDNKASLIVHMITNSPKDPKNLIYLSLILSGVGYLFPINCLINATDYYKKEFCNNNLIYSITLAYILVAVVTVILNNFFVRSIHFSKRIIYGYLLSIIVFCLLTIFVIWLKLIPRNVSYHMLILSASLAAIGCSVQQSSYYGYSSLLPRRYTQALMIGESLSGVLASTLRLSTYLFFFQNPTIYFLLSITILSICLISFYVSLRSSFVQHFLQRNNTTTTTTQQQQQQQQNSSSFSYLGNSQSSGDFVVSSNNQTFSMTSSTSSALPSYQYYKHNTFQYNPEYYRSNSMTRIYNSQLMKNPYHNKSFSLSGPPKSMQSSFTTNSQHYNNHYQPTTSVISSNQQHDEPPPVVESSDDEEMEEFCHSNHLNINLDDEDDDDADDCDDDYDDVPYNHYRHQKSHRHLTNGHINKTQSQNNLTGPNKVNNIFYYIIDRLYKRLLNSRYYEPLKCRWSIIKQIWRQMMAIGLTYLVTLCVFPGIVTEIQSHAWPKAYPLFVLFTFNIFDLIGKLLTTGYGSKMSCCRQWSSHCLLLSAVLRISLLPLILLCVLPQNNPIIPPQSDFWPLFFTALLGITNGYLGCLPMIITPTSVKEADREIAGNIMTTAYNFGLSIGVITAERIKTTYLSSLNSSTTTYTVHYYNMSTSTLFNSTIREYINATTC